MKTIAMYDVIGIQEFIFDSNKVKENVGASLIVQKIFEQYLNEAIKEICNDYLKNWEDCSDFQISSNPKIQAEVVYAAGGNAMVAYQDKTLAIEVTKKLSHKILTKTGGTLKFAVAYHDTEFQNYLIDKDALFEKLKRNKYQMLPGTPLLGIGITRQSNSDRLPATEKDNDEYISKSADFKRKTWKDENGYFDFLLPNKQNYDFPVEFDDLSQKKGEDYIAVVHIDGNNTGKILDELLKTTDYQQSIQTVRQFSKQVDEKYRSIMKKVIHNLAERLKDEDVFNEKLKPVVKERKLLLPIRPIVLNGDDVTFVCNGKIGITLAETFLTELNNEAEIMSDKLKLSACAGIAIVNSHFPFYRSYMLSKTLCNSAKMKGKTLAQINHEKIANWLDFHIVQTGITTELNEIRERFYQVPGMEKPDDLKYEEYGNVLMKFKQYNLLWRPWCVAGNIDEKYKWDTLKAIYKQFEENWKRSRLKKLEGEMTISKNNAEAFIRECKSRGFELPEYVGKSELFIDEKTPYFDVLELLDFL